MVAAIAAADRRRDARGHVRLARSPPRPLAYAIVRLAESFLYNDAIVGIRGDTERLREVEAALLGVG